MTYQNSIVLFLQSEHSGVVFKQDILTNVMCFPSQLYDTCFWGIFVNSKGRRIAMYLLVQTKH